MVTATAKPHVIKQVKRSFSRHRLSMARTWSEGLCVHSDIMMSASGGHVHKIWEGTWRASTTAPKDYQALMQTGSTGLQRVYAGAR